MGSIERGKCRICGRIVDGVERKYYYYGLPCECHSPEHVELVYHCHDCTPEEPEETRITLKSGIARWLGEVWKLFNKVPLPRLRAIAEAERDGRVVVLPCKVGDTVYMVIDFPVVKFGDCVMEYIGEPIMEVLFDMEMLPTWGKEIFATREAAEAALSAGKGE